jgi:hypothetical protein
MPAMKPTLILTWLVLAAPALTAQETARHTLRVLPLGDPPPFVQEVRDGARYEVAPPAGSVPPRLVMIPRPAAAGASPESGQPPVRLRLGRPSAPVTVAAPESRRVNLELERGGTWLSVPLHPCGASLALVWRGGDHWDQARTLVLPDDAAARAEGNVHFTNLTAVAMGVVIGAERIRLEPGKTFSRRLTPDHPAVDVEIFHPAPDGGFQLCHAAQLAATRGSFSRFLIYAADGGKPRLPVKVLQLDEPS